jgi:hypothetical protein
VPTLPTPRGEVSSLLIDALSHPPGALPGAVVSAPADPLADDDFQLALYVAYELHYRGFDGVDERWEWEPSLLALRAQLETIFEDALHAAIGPPSDGAVPEEMDLALRAIAEADEAPSVSSFIEREADAEQVREFAVHRSAYQLKEADPHSWALPRLSGGPKAAMVEIQADEYGGGRPDRVHAQLFAKAMDGLGLDSSYGAYVDHIPGVTLATVNLMSFFGLHRCHRGAIVGHLALFEMTSSIPNGRYARGLRRLGFDDETIDFFDEHVEADAVHENVAAVDLAGGLARDEPAVAPDVLWGARALALLDARWSEHMIERWSAGRSSLLTPLGEPATA